MSSITPPSSRKRKQRISAYNTIITAYNNNTSYIAAAISIGIAKRTAIDIISRYKALGKPTDLSLLDARYRKQLHIGDAGEASVVARIDNELISEKLPVSLKRVKQFINNELQSQLHYSHATRSKKKKITSNDAALTLLRRNNYTSKQTTSQQTKDNDPCELSLKFYYYNMQMVQHDYPAHLIVNADETRIASTYLPLRSYSKKNVKQ